MPARVKQNITLAIDRQLLRQVRALAAHRGSSISAMLAEQLRQMMERETAYRQAQTKALAYLDSPFRLGGAGITSREALHDRQGLR